jgi:Icc-related predicted phosphoesterase
MNRFVFTSDTHLRIDPGKFFVPAGDVFVHCGDGTLNGTVQEMAQVVQWMKGLPHPLKIYVPGNHDTCLCPYEGPVGPLLLKEAGIRLLIDEEIAVNGLSIYGYPWVPKYGPFRFMHERGKSITVDRIPTQLDVLICHGPPFQILDRTGSGNRAGCRQLRDRIDVVKPKLVVFGHIHESYGKETWEGIDFLNVSACNKHMDAVNQPVVVDLPGESIRETGLWI